MIHLIEHHGVEFMIALIVFQNLLRALPEPNAALSRGFGSNSPGYQTLYRFATGLKGDITALGVDPKSLTKSFVKPEETK